MTDAVRDTPAADPVGFRLNFFKLVVRDLDAARRFYTRAFGLVQQGDDVVMPGLREAMLARPGDRFTLVLYQHTDGREITLGSAYGPVGFLTRNLDAALAHVVAEGATCGRGPLDLPGMKVAFVFDPEGHEIELIQMASRAGPGAQPSQEQPQ